MNRPVCALAALILCVTPGAADAAKNAVGAPESQAVTQELLDAVAAELERAAASLRIPDAPVPYFIGYKLTEVDVSDVSASLGVATSETRRHFVMLEVHVHVGSYDRDNSNFVAPRREDIDGIVTLNLALESTPAQARRIAWLATDAAYKEALEQARAKAEAMASGAQSVAGGASYARAKPLVIDKSPSVPALEVPADMRKRAEAISAVYRDAAHVRDSRVSLTTFLERRWYLNNEGTSAQDVRRVSGVLITASSQADDGQELALYYTRYGKTGADLPGDGELKKVAGTIGTRLEALRTAPLVEAYTGPVLFEGEGAIGIVRETLAPHLSGTPPPIGVSADEDIRLGGKLVDRIGLKVVSDLLSVVDDPTVHKAGKRALVGGYRVDDEGIPPRRVQVIKDGKLVELLMSRTPSKKASESNGHARLSLPGGVFRGSATNLFVSGKGGLARAALKKRLLAEVKAQGLPYGIIIRQFDDAAITSSPELSRYELVSLLQTVNRAAPPLALFAHRIYPDGREELVRGVQLEPVDMRAWRDLVAVSREKTVMNFLASVEDPFLHRLRGVGPGYVPSAGIESAIESPDLLFRELELRPSKLGRRPPPLLPRP